jgi:hypothetical protein
VFDLNNPEVVRLEEERRRRDIFDSMRSPLTARLPFRTWFRPNQITESQRPTPVAAHCQALPE